MMNPLKKSPLFSRFAALTAFATCAATATAAGSQLLVYNFGTSSSTYSLAASGIDDNLSAANIWYTAGYINLSRSGANLGGSNANALGLDRNVSGASTMAHSASEAEASNRWIAFMVTPDSGYGLSLDSVSFYANINSLTQSANSVAVAVRIGTDPYVVMGSTLLDNVGITGNGKQYTIALSGLEAITEDVSIRLLFYNTDGSTVTWSAYTRIDDIALNGTLAAIPEASSAGLLLALGTFAAAFRRRKR